MRLRRVASVLFGILLILGGVIGALRAFWQQSAQLPGALVAAPLPSIAVTDMDGRALDLDALRGRPLLINFWATWCPPCREEMPALERVERKWRARGATVVAINFEEDAAAIREYLAQNGLSLPVYQDEDGLAAQLLDITYLPTTLFVDATGVIRSRQEGGLTQGQMEAGLRLLVDERP